MRTGTGAGTAPAGDAFKVITGASATDRSTSWVGMNLATTTAPATAITAVTMYTALAAST